MNAQTATFDVFEKSAQKTNQILNFIEAKYKWEDHRHLSYAALRAVIHTLRDRLPFEVVIHFGAQLPTFIRGVYYEGWNPSKTPQKMDREEFLNAIRNQLPFSFEGSLEELIETVVMGILRIVDHAEIEKIKKTLPKDLRNLFD